MRVDDVSKVRSAIVQTRPEESECSPGAPPHTLCIKPTIHPLTGFGSRAWLDLRRPIGCLVMVPIVPLAEHLATASAVDNGHHHLFFGRINYCVAQFHARSSVRGSAASSG